MGSNVLETLDDLLKYHEARIRLTLDRLISAILLHHEHDT